MEDVSFYTTQFKMDTQFEETVFAKDVNFQNTSFRTLFFASPKVWFGGKIDLRGCTYDRIDPTSIWEELTDRLEPYDRQPYTQLEQTFRQAGEEDLANKVYYKRKRLESSRITLRRPDAWILDRFLWLLTGYGVQLWRLLVAIALILVIGTFIFHVDGAVEPKQIYQPPPIAEIQGKADEKLSLTCFQAFWVSLNLFLPIEIPSGSEWKPSSQALWKIRFTTFATLLKLLGWILVPVGVAGLSGWLKH
jgi:hypothetical protein